MSNNLPAPIVEIRQQLDKMDGEFQCALPPHITVEKFKRVAMTSVQGNPNLLRADRRSLFGACVKCAQDGLLPDGREAALVIFGNYVQYIPMVAGILKRIRNSGELKTITARIVHRNDEFRCWVDDTGEHILHEYDLFAERGDIVGVYARAETKDGGIYLEPMTKKEVEKVRAVSRSSAKGPWVDWWEEMARKTAIRRLSKRLPMSTDLDDMLNREPETVITEPAEPVYPRQSIEQFEQVSDENDQKLIGSDGEQHAGEEYQVIDLMGGLEYRGLDKQLAIATLKKITSFNLNEKEMADLRDANSDLWNEVFPPEKAA